MPGLGADGEELHPGLEDGGVDAGSDRQIAGLEVRLQRGESERVGAAESAESRGLVWEAVVDQGDTRAGRYLSQLYLVENDIRAKDLSRYEYLGRHDKVGIAVGRGERLCIG